MYTYMTVRCKICGYETESEPKKNDSGIQEAPEEMEEHIRLEHYNEHLELVDGDDGINIMREAWEVV